MFQTLLREYRSHWMARFTFWITVCLVAIRIAGQFQVRAPGEIRLVVWLGIIAAGVYYLIRLGKFIRNRMLWRLSRRLIVTYLFIGLVPIVLILALVGIGAMIINGQFAAFLVNTQLQTHFDELKQLNRVIAHEAIHTRARTPQGLIRELQDFYRSDLSQYGASYPQLEITLRVGSYTQAFGLTGNAMVQPVSLPRWLRGEEWAGIVMDQNQLALRAVDQEETPAGKLTLILSMPVTPTLLDLVGQGIGPVEVYEPRPSGGQPRVLRSSSLRFPASVSWFDFPVMGFSEINPIEWELRQFKERDVPVVVAVHSRIFTLNGQLFRTLGRHSSAPLEAFVVVGIVFLIIELIALIIGVKLARTITSTVGRLQVATERVKAGDFSHRIGLPARDQVSALGEAFDTMTASIQRLMQESQEKLRLESELKIAHEVQTQLFPQQAPELPGVKMFGICRPARGVSGDYYDFLRLGHERVGLALGDVSGKGIFAALLMASIQSAIHAQFYDGRGTLEASALTPISPAELLLRLNRQLYENTPEGKYATFFYAVYDARSHTLTYSNAGHPPPFLFRRDGLLRLDQGGTVLGLFPDVHFQQGQIELHAGDLLLAFTDGMTEPENSYGEEFGEERLVEVVREAIDSPPEFLAEQIYRAVTDWTGSSDLQDDMTMLYLKTLATMKPAQ